MEPGILILDRRVGREELARLVDPAVRDAIRALTFQLIGEGEAI